MKPPKCSCKDASHMEEELFASDKMDHIAKILDAKYKPENLKELTDKLPQLNENKKQLHVLLDKRCELFDGTLGLWKGLLYKIDLQDDAKPHHAPLYSIPHAYKQTFKQEAEQLCKVGVLRKIIGQNGLHLPF